MHVLTGRLARAVVVVASLAITLAVATSPADEERRVFFYDATDVDTARSVLTFGTGLQFTTTLDIFEGNAAYELFPDQRFRDGLFDIDIRENPIAGQTPKQYRYLTVAVKKLTSFGGLHVMLFSNPAISGDFLRRGYYWGDNLYEASEGTAIQASGHVPLHWEVFTFDLFADYGAFNLDGWVLRVTGLDFEAEDFIPAYFDKMILHKTPDEPFLGGSGTIHPVLFAPSHHDAVFTQISGLDVDTGTCPSYVRSRGLDQEKHIRVREAAAFNLEADLTVSNTSDAHYLTFAWKTTDGAAVGIQVTAVETDLAYRFFAGDESAIAWPPTPVGIVAVNVSDVAPSDWELVTVDLIAAGGNGTATAITLVPATGASADFDHIIFHENDVTPEFGGTYGTGADPTSAYDCDKPTYTVFPADGEDIPIDVQVITITFSEPMQDGTEGEGNCTTSGVSICGEEDTVTVVSSWNPERTQLSVIPTGLQPDLNYTLIIPQDLVDESGRPVDHGEIIYRTVREVIVDNVNGTDENDCECLIACKSIQCGIVAMSRGRNGGIVNVLPGVYSGENNTNLEFFDNQIQVIGNSTDPSDVVIDCGGTSLFSIASNEDKLRIFTTTFANMEIRNAAAAASGGVGVISSAFMKFSNVFFNAPQVTGDGNGGALTITSGTVFIDGSRFVGASAARGGAIHATDSRVVITDTTFEDMTATESGSLIYATASDIEFDGVTTSGTLFSGTDGGCLWTAAATNVTLFGSALDGCISVTGSGGCVHMAAGGLLNVTESALTGSTAAAGDGGGIWGEELDAGSVIVNSTISGSTAVRGTAVYLSAAAAVAVDTLDLSDNQPGSVPNGGVVHLTAAAALTGTGLTLTGQTSGLAMFLSDSASIDLDGSVVSDNANPDGPGGAILAITSSSVAFNNSFLERNVATGNGGAIYGSDLTSLSLSNTSLTDNTATGGSGGGVGVATAAVVTVEDSSLTGNLAVNGSGGGLSVQAVTLMEMTGSVLNGNEATVDGGALYAADSLLHVAASAIDSNTAGVSGGGLSVVGGSPTMEDTSVADNLAASGMGGGLVADNPLNGTLTNCTFTANTAAVAGGGAAHLNGGALSLVASNFSDNVVSDPVAGLGGGSLYVTGGATTLHGATVSTSMVAAGSGAGLLCNPCLPLFLRDATFSDNEIVGSGGALFLNNSAVDIEGASFVDNTASANGGAIYVTTDSPDFAWRLVGPLFVGNSAASGGALYIAAGTDEVITFANGTFDDNVATGSGGALHTAISVRIEGGAFLRNRGTTTGGALFTSGNSVVLDGVLFADDTSEADGGALGIASGVSVTITDSTFVDCSAGGQGGALKTFDSPVTMERTTFVNGTATEGGAMYISGLGSIVAITNMTCAGNVASGDGGALWMADGDVTVTDSTFSSSIGGRGGGVAAYNMTLTLGANAFAHNTAVDGPGGGLYVSGINLRLEGEVFEGNSANGAGGGLFATDLLGVFSVSAGRFLGNTAGGGDGGGFYITSSSTLISDGTVLADNVAVAGSGGALFVVDAAALTLEAGTIVANNTAAVSGGGFATDRVGTTTVTASTIQGNAVDGGIGGGAFIADGQFTISDSVFAANSAANGSAIFLASAASMTLSDSDLDANTASSFGTLYLDRAVADLATARFSGNVAASAGCIYNLDSTINLGNNTFANNTAVSGVGGVLVASTTDDTIFDDCLFEGNYAEAGGGVLYATAGNVYVTSCQADGNGVGSGAEGGFVLVDSADASLIRVENSMVINNFAGASGGAVALAGGRVEVDSSVLRANEAPFGGAVKLTAGASFSVVNSAVDGHVGSFGGSFSVVDGSGYIEASNVTDNRAEAGAGLFLERVDLVVNGSRFGGNMADEGASLYARDSNVIVIDSVVHGNQADRGAGVYGAGSGAVTMVDTELEGNSALGGAGGVVFVEPGVGLNLTRVTASGNVADVGGVVAVAGNESDCGGVTLLVDQSAFSDNAATIAGGVVGSVCEIQVQESSLTGCEAGQNGGCLAVSGLVSSNNHFQASSASRGGAIFVAAPSRVLMGGEPLPSDAPSAGSECRAVMSGETFVANNATRSGGDLVVAAHCTATVAMSSFENSMAAFGGAVAVLSGGDGTLSAVNITGARAGVGGALAAYHAASFAIVDGSVVDDVAAVSGGAVWSLASTGSVTEATITSAVAGDSTFAGFDLSPANDTEHASAYGAAADPVAAAAYYLANAVPHNGTVGGAFAVEGGLLTVANAVIEDAAADGSGGGFFVSDGADLGSDGAGSLVLVINGATFTACSAHGDGGAGFVTQAGVELTSITIEQATSSSSNGGGLAVADGGAVTLDGGHIDACTAASAGGGVHVEAGGSLTLTGGVTFASNAATAGNGGAINLEPDAAFTTDHWFCADNRAGNNGGCIAGTGLPMTVVGGVFERNEAANDGGAIAVTHNDALALIGSSFVGNSAGDRGGAVLHTDASSFTMEATSVSGSLARQGGVYVEDVASVTVGTGSTFSFNVAELGAGLLVSRAANLTVTGEAGLRFDSNTANQVVLVQNVAPGSSSGATPKATGPFDFPLPFSGCGSMLILGSNFSVDGVTCFNNTAGFGAGVCVADNGHGTLSNLACDSNTAINDGGCAYLSFTHSVNITNLASTNARAFGGSAVFVDRSDFVTISNLLASHSFGSAGAVGTFLSNDFLLSNATFLDITGDTEGAVSFSRGLRALLTGIRVDGAEIDSGSIVSIFDAEDVVVNNSSFVRATIDDLERANIIFAEDCQRCDVYDLYFDQCSAEAVVESNLGGFQTMVDIVVTLNNNVEYAMSIRDVSFISFDQLDFSVRKARIIGSVAVFTRCRFFDVNGGVAVALSDSTVDMYDCEFFNNTGVVGSAVVVENTAAFDAVGNPSRFINCSFYDNYAFTGGAVLMRRSRTVFENCSFVNNTAASEGGALALVSFAPATNLFDSCVFRSNAGDDGGAVFVGESGGTFVNCLFEDNESGSGGAVHLTAAGTTYISNSTFVGNTASFGGATYVSRRSKGFFTDSVFADNVATSKGGAVSGAASAVGTYTRCNFARHSAVFAGGVVHVKGRSKMYFYTADMSDNTAPKGGVVSAEVEGSVSLDGVVLARNKADDGGVFYLGTRSAATFSNVEFTDNAVTREGGVGVAEAFAKVTVNGASMRRNTAVGSGTGIILYGSSTATITSLDAEGQVTTDVGAFLTCQSDGSLTITNSTFARGTALDGGCVHFSSECSGAVTGSSFTGCEAAQDGGAVAAPSSVTFTNTLFADNVGSFGGALTFVRDSPSTSSAPVVGCTFRNNFAGSAGGGVYWEDSEPSFDPFCDGCVYDGNVALGFGADFASPPVRLSFKEGFDLPTETRPELIFDIAFTAFDFFGTVANLENATEAAPFQFYINSLSLAGLDNQLQGVDNVPLLGGDVSFLSLQLRGEEFETDYTLEIFSEPPTTVLHHNITLYACGPGFTELFDRGVRSCQQCIPGQFNLDGGDCHECPFGAQCLGGDQILAQPGFWRDPDSGTLPIFHQCVAQGACCPDGGCTVGEECTVNRAGPLCGHCIEDHYLWNGNCIYCHRTSIWPILPSLLGVVGLVLYSLNKVPTTDGFFKIVAYFLQVLPLLVGPISGFFKVFETFNFNPDILSGFSVSDPTSSSGADEDVINTCITKASPIQKISFQLAFPIAIYTTLGVIFIIHQFLRKCVKFAIVQRPNVIYVSASASLSVVAYSSIARGSLELTACFKTTQGWFLQSATDVECFSSEHLPYLAVAIFLIVAYVIGYPVAIIIALYRVKKKSDIGLDSLAHYRRWGILYSPYKKAMFWWEAVFILRRTLNTILFVFFFGSPYQRTLSLLILSFIFAIMHLLARPFVDPRDNDLEVLSLLTLVAAAGFGQVEGEFALFFWLEFLLLVTFGIACAWTLVSKMIDRFGHRPIVARLLCCCINLRDWVKKRTAEHPGRLAQTARETYELGLRNRSYGNIEAILQRYGTKALYASDIGALSYTDSSKSAGSTFLSFV